LDCALKIGLLLSLSGPWKAGRTIPGAAALAVQAINADPSLLGGMRVEYIYVDAGFTVSSGNDAMSKLLAMKGLDAVFGPGESSSFRLCAASLTSAVAGRHIDARRMLCSIGRGLRVDGAAQRLFQVASRDRTTVWRCAGAGVSRAKLVPADVCVHRTAVVGHGDVSHGARRFARACLRCHTLTDVTEV
jgi:hypothetical protein